MPVSYSPHSFTLKKDAVDLMSPEYTKVFGNEQYQTDFPTRRNMIQSLAPSDKQQPASSLTNDQFCSLKRFIATSPNDLDAVFDELATLERSESLDRHPQFMENLGFAPDMSLSDVLTPDYSSLDSGYGSLMGRGKHSGNLEPSVGDQRRPSESL